MGCLYLEIEGRSCLVGSVDQGWMKNRQNGLLDRMTQKRVIKEKLLSHIFPKAMLPGIFQQITTQNSLQTFWPNHRLSIVTGLRYRVFFFRQATSLRRQKQWLLQPSPTFTAACASLLSYQIHTAVGVSLVMRRASAREQYNGLIEGSRLVRSGLSVQFPSRAKRFRPPCIRIPPFSDRFVGGRTPAVPNPKTLLPKKRETCNAMSPTPRPTGIRRMKFFKCNYIG